MEGLAHESHKTVTKFSTLGSLHTMSFTYSGFDVAGEEW